MTTKTKKTTKPKQSDKATAVATKSQIVPTHLDVLFGRGFQKSKCEGNRRHLALVMEQAETYRGTKKRFVRSSIIQRIVQKILDSGGRFLQRTDDGEWIDAGIRLGRQNTGNLLRDGPGYKWDGASTDNNLDRSNNSSSSNNNDHQNAPTVKPTLPDSTKPAGPTRTAVGWAPQTRGTNGYNTTKGIQSSSNNSGIESPPVVGHNFANRPFSTRILHHPAAVFGGTDKGTQGRRGYINTNGLAVGTVRGIGSHKSQWGLQQNHTSNASKNHYGMNATNVIGAHSEPACKKRRTVDLTCTTTESSQGTDTGTARKNKKGRAPNSGWGTVRDPELPSDLATLTLPATPINSALGFATIPRESSDSGSVQDGSIATAKRSFGTLMELRKKQEDRNQNTKRGRDPPIHAGAERNDNNDNDNEDDEDDCNGKDIDNDSNGNNDQDAFPYYRTCSDTDDGW